MWRESRQNPFPFTGKVGGILREEEEEEGEEKEEEWEREEGEERDFRKRRGMAGSGRISWGYSGGGILSHSQIPINSIFSKEKTRLIPGGEEGGVSMQGEEEEGEEEEEDGGEES